MILMNRLTVVGPESVLRGFIDKVASVGSLVKAYSPLPENAYVELFGGAMVFSELDVEGIDGYGLAMALWGSQWGDLELTVADRQFRTVEYEFITMNAPIVAGLARIAALNRPLGFAMSGISANGSWCGGSYATAGELVRSYEVEVEGERPTEEAELEEWVARMADLMHDAVIEKLKRHGKQ